MEKQLTVPMLHLNGSSGESLREGYLKAVEALENAINMVRATAPHGRDYYMKSESAMHLACEEHEARYNSLVAVKDELKTLAISVARQQREREERKMK